jgi:anti-sigma factor ChrR (cupin superfamily)
MSERTYPGLLAGGWKDLAYEHFREGIAVHWLVRGGADEASLAILRYEAGARVPRHLHAGLETIMVLDGIQSDENGSYAAGTVVTNARGTTHSVWTEHGCSVLIHWSLPVVILDEGRSS